MKNLNKILYACLLVLLCSVGVSAQVSFTNMGGELGSIPGFTYEDCAVDMNGDHLDDVVRVTGDGLYIDYQQPDGSFTQNVFPMNFQTLPSWSMCAGDIDGNGYNDLLFGGGSTVSFIYANDDGSAYTEDYHEEYIFSQRSTFADIDNDGNLDAFVCHDVDQSHPYRNDGSGVLTEDQSLIETLDLAGNYAAIWVDYDNDWDTDLYITKCRQGSSAGDIERTNAMYRNNGDGSYTEVGAEIGLDDNAQSWATVFEDFDNDGDFDAFIVNHDEQNRFMVNDGTGNFTESIMTSGITPNDLGAWENASGDFNNDGFVDIFSELGNELYINNGDMTFTGMNLPFDDGGIGDFNNDGFLDVVQGNALYINDTNDNNWFKVNTLGIISNKNGIGARIEIYGDWGIQIREVRSGESFSPMSSLTVHFGLGTATEVDSMVIKWPSGILTTLSDLDINTTYNIPEADCLLAGSTLTVNGVTEFCAGESVELSAPAGFDSYIWSNGATTQSIIVTEAGNYSANLAEADGCLSLTNSVVVSIIADEVPTIALEGDEIFCAGGSAVLNTTSTANPVWSNNESGQTITVTETGTYYVQAESVCSNDLLSSEEISIVVLEAQDPVAQDVAITQPGPATITATGDNLEWYDDPVGGNLIGTGNSFEFTNLISDTSVYVESHLIEGGALQNGGKLDNSGGGGLPSTGAHSFFNVVEPFTLLSVTVYLPDNAPAGDRVIQLVDVNDVILTSTTVNLSAPGQYVVDLNFEVPVGNDFSLRCPQNNLFRNDSGVNYPYAIGDVGTLTTSVYGVGYYYYFYDWKIEKEKVECISDRVIANASLVVSTDEIPGVLTDFAVYPNPAHDEVNISFEALEQMDLSIQLYDMTGREVISIEEFSVNSGVQTKQLNVADLAKGIYQMQLISDGKSVNRRLVVQ